MVGVLSLASMSCGRALLSLQQRPALVGNWRPLCRISTLSMGTRNAVQLGREYHRNHRMKFTRGQHPALKNWREQRRIHVAAVQVTALESNQGVFYSEIGAERAGEHRTDAAWLADAFSQETTLVIPVMENKSLAKHGKAVFLHASAIEGLDHHEPIFLGLSKDEKVPIFTVAMKKLLETDAIQLDEGVEWVDVRRYGIEDASEAGLLAYARGMVEWHSRNRYCGHCGSKMVPKEGGHSLRCSAETCGRCSYPRMDPAVIMLITSGDYVLLGRQARWEAGRYSVLAGFVEIGESFEKAVVREVKEEAGIDIDVSRVRYVASQPWPFPSSVMVGFRGAAKPQQVEHYNALAPPHGQAISVGVELVPEVDEVNALPRLTADGKELEDVRWVHRTFVRSRIIGQALPHGQEFSLPGKSSISKYLLKAWSTEDPGPQWAGSDVPTVDIDEGSFKYVLMRMSDQEGNQKLVVRGTKAFAYHTDILGASSTELKPLGLEVEQLGGGRMEHQPTTCTLHVFSSSQAFGQADHTVTSALLRQSFPLHTITISWDP
ncbi:unnamed protein product [Calypogeia fissa]